MEKSVWEIKDLNITQMEDDEEYQAVHHMDILRDRL